ncbi:rho GTPase-activating protein 19 isoform X2 [Tribolium castaneum]|uniref:rho GTPase-activating protein 19 isoform X2 n=1 Tax=Tribolium castaneum TaxID=7070 RepID=UPI00046BF71E|nr:PREDICTED: rho GTPase-activating protein 19 isoform X2 [Tribolium castaneum]|eukprot:XP_008198135.1 PREDICTED: rho GTPase-activating protein 19 isoform X2 [Tribolium castaneum]
MCEPNLSDESLTEKFKREFNEQFHILVRMHLSFLLDQATNEHETLSEKNRLKKWSLVPFNKKKSKGALDGAPLTQEGICQVYQLIEFLKKEQNIKVEGVFRRTGSLARQQELRNLLSRGVTLELEGGTYSIHDCASVLKGFLAELPDPLLTEAHYPAYCQIAELCVNKEKTVQEEKLLAALQLLLLLLPNENKVLLKDILDLLNFTASFESFNRMSADNLAKLFTPHLLCPRKLTPEQLHVTSQTLAGIVSFMIVKNSELFKIPQNLILEFRARYEKRRALSANCLNESATDQCAASTVFTFVDQERTAKENETNTTETALAQLYAHIQSLPESSKKRKLVKQFNKENGHGTPLQVLRSGVQKNKSLGDSIKKHIFHKSVVKSLKKRTPPLQTALARARLFCTNCDSSPDQVASDEPQSKKIRRSTSETEGETPDAETGIGITSTPACVALHFTPDDQERKSMSPITRSTQRMTRAMQETMMTPRSRKPVLLVSGTNINTLAKIETVEAMDEVPEEVEKDNSLSQTFREYLENRSMLTTSSPAADSSFSSRTDDFNSDLSPSKMTDSLLSCLDGNDPGSEKELVLKPKQFDENGQPIVFETSF